jgi:hypothetical protein
MNVRVLGAAALAVAAFVSLSASAQTTTIQKWVDKDGKVHFGDVPPPDANTTEVQVKVTPPSEIPPPKPVPSAVKTDPKTGAPPLSRADREEQEREARRKQDEINAAAAAQKRAQECQKRIAQVQRDGRNVRNWARQGSDTRSADASIARDDEWIAKNCN